MLLTPVANTKTRFDGGFLSTVNKIHVQDINPSTNQLSNIHMAAIFSFFLQLLVKRPE